MTSQVMELDNILTPDYLATRITEKFIEYDSLRTIAKNTWREILEYVYATDTTQTSNSSLPWKNKTIVPKLCQIADNLYANYVATTFPQRKSITWEANEKSADSRMKRDSIVNYMTWCTQQPYFKHEYDKILLDYIYKGNGIGTVQWIDERIQRDDKTTTGYLGPGILRVNPNDCVINPTAESFQRTPKIIRSIVNMGEVKEILQRLSNDENRIAYEELWDYMKNVRAKVTSFSGDMVERDRMYAMDGFTSFRDYLKSDFCEILTFYGDIYDKVNDIFYKNHVIQVIDRHKLLDNKPNPSWFGTPPIHHVPWRKRLDNLWGMGPLNNLVGMQYRMDHVENMKADVMDLTTYPVQMITGFVEDFTWRPGEKIYVGEEGKVELIVPDVNALNANFEIQNLEKLMEEMAGAPREAMGFRTPGEKTKYEVQRLENAAARVFQNKIRQFEEQMLEPLLNSMLELARRNLTEPVSIQVFDDEQKAMVFQTLTAEDITGVGRLKAVGARHFAEQADIVQNLTSLSQSPLWATVQPHFSGIKLAGMFEEMFNIKDLEIVMPYVALAEQADAQKLANNLQEQVATEAGTATGMGGDFDLSPQEKQQIPTPIPEQ